MNRQEFDMLVAGIVADTATLLVAKGGEYASDKDRLENFKRNAEKQGITPFQVWKVYYGKHVDSIDTYFRRVHAETLRMSLHDMKQDGLDLTFEEAMKANLPEAMNTVEKQLSEPIEGRFYDIINYCILGIALLHDGREGRL